MAKGSKETKPTQQSLLNGKKNRNWYQIIPLFFPFCLRLSCFIRVTVASNPMAVSLLHLHTTTLKQPFLKGILHLCWRHSSREETEWTKMCRDVLALSRKKIRKSPLMWQTAGERFTCIQTLEEYCIILSYLMQALLC